ncbi:MAG: response regulator transcription factor [Spirochaetales bacterium]|nr:response regulator transcription factor [Spirochaetales bacterium]
MAIKVMIADDHKIVRDGIRAILEKEPDIEVAGEAENGRELLDKAAALKPDIVLMDISMPQTDGVGAAEIFRDADYRPKILVVSMHNERHFVDKMLKLGVSGYVLKNASATELVSAIKRVKSGKKYLSPELLDGVIDNYRSQAEHDLSRIALTERETVIIRKICEGKMSKEIAFDLNLSKKSIDLIRSQIMKKLQLQTTAELIKFAIKQGISELE